MARPRILLIYTGGTIGMIENTATHSLQPFDFSHLIENVPKLRKLDYDVDNIQFNPPLDSSDMGPDHWAEIARAIEANYDDYDGFVVLHGTDTMAYTASALSFMLRNLAKPVIITGSQLPIGEVRTDGEENLITAVQIAAAKVESGTMPMIQEVAILFENHLWRGNRATKSSADNFNAFSSNNYPELASIGLDIRYNHEWLRRADHRRHLEVDCRMSRDVMFITVHPGISYASLRHQLATPGLKGVVLKTYGAGNAPTAPWFVGAIAEAIERGVVVVAVSQCPNGEVNLGLYETSRQLAGVGVVSGLDITSEAAITKLMHLFGRGMAPAQVAEAMERPLCGEMRLKQLHSAKR